MIIKTQEGKIYHKKDILFIADKSEYKYFVLSDSSTYRKDLKLNSSIIDLSLTEESIGNLYNVSKK